MSWVRVQLTELSDGGTRLRLDHIAHVPDEFWNQFGPGAVGVGWDLTLMGLGRHISTPSMLDPQQAAAWSGSDEGRAFMRRSSDEWCQASIASGTSEESA